MFHNRVTELNAIREQYRLSRERNRLLVIYGRRRIGKTSLVKEFLKEVRGVYIFVEPKSEELVLRDCEAALGTVLEYPPRLEDWTTLFTICRKERLVLVMDEFQNLGAITSHLYSRFQNLWDSIESGSGLLFIVIGSYVGMIKRLFRDGKQPLFGRASGMMRLEPFPVFDTVSFLASLGVSFEDSLLAYTVFGGVPRYLIEYGSRGASIEDTLLEPTSFPREEGINILSMEFGSRHRGYFSVLESLGKGKATPSEIADHAGMNLATVSKYLGELAGEYEMVIGEQPFGQRNRKLVRYRIRDNFFRFWFTFVHANASLLEIDGSAVYDILHRDLPDHVARRMEAVIREIILGRKQPMAPAGIGRWWNRRSVVPVLRRRWMSGASGAPSSISRRRFCCQAETTSRRCPPSGLRVCTRRRSCSTS